MNATPTISYLSDVYFDSGAVNLLPELLIETDIFRPLLVTDSGLVKRGMVERLNVSAFGTYDGVETNPTEAQVYCGLIAYRENDCDGIVALGGGSSIDLAKCIAILVGHSEPLEQYAILRGVLRRFRTKCRRSLPYPPRPGVVAKSAGPLW